MIDAPRAWPLDATSPESALASLGPGADLWSGADVVGVGSTARTVRELHVVAHGLVRLLVERLGFGSVLVEGDQEASEGLHIFVREGTGDPRATLVRARPFLATEEMLDLVLWLRHRNEQDPADGVRIVHGGAADLSSPTALEHSLAEQAATWHERFGDRIVYLGGAAHTAVVAERVAALAPTQPVRSAGSLLRDRLGTRYSSVGLTFGSGAIPQHVPPPAPVFLEDRLDELPHVTALVATRDLRDAPRWIAGTDRVRLVGPSYDPRDDPDHSMIGNPANWFDVIVHQKVATSVRFLS